MYHFREITLKNNRQERKRLIIEFDDPKYEIVAQFVMSDASMLDYQVLQEIDQVLSEKTAIIETSGNRCSLTIEKETTIIEDLYEDMFDEVATYEKIEIPTETFRNIIVDWKEKAKMYSEK